MRLGTMFTTLTMALLASVSLPAQDQISLTVNATMDIYRAGGYNDGSNGIAPVVFTFPAGGWRTMTFPTVGGAWGCQNGLQENGADGESSGQCTTNGAPSPNFNSIGPFSGIHLTDSWGPLVGIFLGNTLPVSAPGALRFYVSDNSQGGIKTNFLTLSPQIGQVFFIGDGLTGTGTGVLQTFIVPPAATHLYLGYLDTCKAPNDTAPNCYSDNVGSLSVTARLQYYIPDWLAPTLTTSSPSARGGMGLAYDAAGYYALLFGGSDFGPPNDDTWIWLYGWYQLSPATSPSARGFAGTAYDPSTGTVVLFGGTDANGNKLNDTWIWNGITWTQQFPPVSPPPRSLTSDEIVYDPLTETVLLFGGSGTTINYNGGIPFGDRNGMEERRPGRSSSRRRARARAQAPLAYDPITKTIVLFGGDDGGGDCCRTFFGDTWTWNGLNWTEQSSANSPPARTAHLMTYDPSIFQVVMFGGTAGPPSALGDTWAWNGTKWTQLNLLNSPSGRWNYGLVFDPLIDGLLLFGGELGGDPLTNQTWLLLPVPLP